MPKSYKHYLENDSILVVFQHSQHERKSKTTFGGVVKMRDYLLIKGILLLCFHKIQIGSCFQKLGFL